LIGRRPPRTFNRIVCTLPVRFLPALVSRIHSKCKRVDLMLDVNQCGGCASDRSFVDLWLPHA
jgi:hypothetical protein